MKDLPHRGTSRSDIRPGLRLTHLRGRTIIAYVIAAEQVEIIGLHYGGRDIENLLLDDSESAI